MERSNRGGLPNTLHNSRHPLQLHCRRCQTILVQDNEIFRVYNRNFWAFSLEGENVELGKVNTLLALHLHIHRRNFNHTNLTGPVDVNRGKETYFVGTAASPLVTISPNIRTLKQTSWWNTRYLVTRSNIYGLTKTMNLHISEPSLRCPRGKVNLQRERYGVPFIQITF
jgi:hypothetical protein